MFQAFVIHKKGDPTRLNAIVNRLSNTDAINQITIVMDETSDLYESTLQEKSLYLKHLPEMPIRMLSAKELSVSHKHFSVMTQIVASNKSSIVFEDDVIFDFRILDDYLSRLAHTELKFDFIFFGTGCNLSIPGSGFVRTIPPMSKCADSLVISPTGAKKYLDSLSSEGIHLPIDFDMNYRFPKLSLDVFWYEPGITFQGSQNGIYKSSVQESSLTFGVIRNLLLSPKLLLNLVLRKITNVL